MISTFKQIWARHIVIHQQIVNIIGIGLELRGRQKIYYVVSIPVWVLICNVNLSPASLMMPRRYINLKLFLWMQVKVSTALFLLRLVYIVPIIYNVSSWCAHFDFNYFEFETILMMSGQVTKVLRVRSVPGRRRRQRDDEEEQTAEDDNDNKKSLLFVLSCVYLIVIPISRYVRK